MSRFFTGFSLTLSVLILIAATIVDCTRMGMYNLLPAVEFIHDHGFILGLAIAVGAGSTSWNHPTFAEGRGLPARILFYSFLVVATIMSILVWMEIINDPFGILETWLQSFHIFSAVIWIFCFAGVAAVARSPKPE